jgi:hypothetical protein
MYESGWQKLTQVCLPRIAKEFEEELIIATLPIK